MIEIIDRRERRQKKPEKTGKQAKKTVRLFSNIQRRLDYDSSDEDY